MNQAEIITPWAGSGTTADPNSPRLPTDHAVEKWEDATGQPSANLQPAPNLLVVRAVMTDSVLAAIESDTTYEVLWSESSENPV